MPDVNFNLSLNKMPVPPLKWQICNVFKSVACLVNIK